MASSATSTDTSLISAAFLRLLAVQSVFGLSYSSLLLLPKFFRTELHASATHIGLASSMALFSAALAAPLVGLSGRHISRRAWLVLGLALEACAAFVFLWVDQMGPLVWLLRAAQGIAWTVIFNVTATWAADLIPKERMAQAIGYLGLSMLMTNAAAPLVAEPLATHFGWNSVFILSGTAALFGLLLVPSLPAGIRTETQAKDPSASPFRSLLPVHYASLLMGTGIGLMVTFTQPFALLLGASRVGDLFLGHVLAAAFVRLVLARLADRVGPALVATYSLTAYACVALATAWMTPSALFFLGLGLGASHGLLYPALTAVGLGTLGQATRTVFMGYFSAAFSLGWGLSTLGFGKLADLTDFPTIFVLGGLLLATGIIPLARIVRRC
jgi:MFS family permease